MKHLFEKIKHRFQVNIDYNQLDGHIEDHIKKVNQQIKRRDLLEYSAILFVFTSFMYQLVSGQNSMFEIIGILLIIMSCFIVGITLYKNRANTLDKLTLYHSKYI